VQPSKEIVMLTKEQIEKKLEVAETSLERYLLSEHPIHSVITTCEARIRALKEVLEIE
jgi:hypothetical protein